MRSGETSGRLRAIGICFAGTALRMNPRIKHRKIVKLLVSIIRWSLRVVLWVDYSGILGVIYSIMLFAQYVLIIVWLWTISRRRHLDKYITRAYNKGLYTKHRQKIRVIRHERHQAIVIRTWFLAPSTHTTRRISLLPRLGPGNR